MGNMGRRCAWRLGFSIQQPSQTVLPENFSRHIQETNHRRGTAYGDDVIHPGALKRAKQGSRTMSNVDDHDACSDPPHRVDHGEQVSSRWNQDRDPIARADSPAREGVGELGNTTLECPPRHISEKIGRWRCFRRCFRICTRTWLRHRHRRRSGTSTSSPKVLSEVVIRRFVRVHEV
jgi:hypothetical protein